MKALFTLWIALSSVAMAENRVHLGVLAGFGFSGATGLKPTRGEMTKPEQFVGGVLVDLPVQNNFSLETGLHYTPHKFGYLAADGSRRFVRTHSLELPVMARMWFWNLVSVGAGGYAAHAIGEVYTHNSNDDDYYTEWSEAEMHQLDYGLLFGTQLRCPLSEKLKLLIDSRYNLGLRDVRTEPKGDAVQYRVMRFTAGVALEL